MFQAINSYFNGSEQSPKQVKIVTSPETEYFKNSKKETTICLFLYGYLVYNYDFCTKNNKPEEKIAFIRKTWEKAFDFFKY